MVAIRIEGSLGEDRTRTGALEDQRRAVVLTPHQMDRPAPYEMHNADRVVEVEYRCTGRELAFAPTQSLKKRSQVHGHDFYHVPQG